MADEGRMAMFMTKNDEIRQDTIKDMVPAGKSNW